MNSIEVHEKPDGTTVVLSGPATGATADRRHSALMKALQTKGSVTVDCQALTDWDVTLWQHLVSFKKALQKQNRKLELCPQQLPEKVIHSIRVCGLSSVLLGKNAPDKAESAV